jgi:hypothetical protein
MDGSEHVAGLIFGRWRSQILHAGVTLGIFDAMETAPLASTQVAERLGLDPAHTYRLMRALGTLDLLREEPAGSFAITPAGAIRDGRQNAFVREFGRMAFEHTALDPTYAAVFNDAMSRRERARPSKRRRRGGRPLGQAARRGGPLHVRRRRHVRADPRR